MEATFDRLGRAFLHGMCSVKLTGYPVLILGLIGLCLTVTAAEPRMGFVLEDGDSSQQQVGDADYPRELVAQAEAAEDEAPDIETLYRRGKSLYRAGRYAEAIVFFQRVLDMDSNYRSARNYLTESQTRLERTEETEPSLSEEDLVDNLLEIGREAYRAEDYDKSSRAFRRVLEIDPDNSSAQRYLDRIEQQTGEQWAGDVEEAEQQQDPEILSKALIDEGRELLDEEDYDGAIAAFEEAVSVNPDSSRARKYLEKAREEKQEAAVRAREERVDRLIDEGRDYLRDDRYDEAIMAFQNALELDPGNRRADDLLAGAVEEKNEAIAEAQREAREAEIRAQQEKMDRLYDEGRDLMRDDRFDEAIAKFNAILEIDPENERARERLGEAIEEKREAEQEAEEERLEQKAEQAEDQLDEGNLEQALSMAEEVLAEDPEQDTAQDVAEEAREAIAEREKKKKEQARKQQEEEAAPYLDRAQIYLEADQLDKAEAELNEVLEKYPESQRGQQLMASLEKRREEIAAEKARQEEEARKAEQARIAAEAQALFEEGKALYEEGKVLEAVEKWNQTLELVPEHEQAKAYLEQTKDELQAALEEKAKQEAEAEKQSEVEEMLNRNVPLLELPDADIDNVLALLGTISGFNIVATEGVEGTITVNIKNKTMREALDMILTDNGFGYTVDGKDIRVFPDFRTEIFPLTEEQFEKIRKIIEDPESLENPTEALERLIYGQLGISTIPSKDLRLNPNTMTLIVTDTDENIEKVRQFLENIPEFKEGRQPLVTRHWKLDADRADKVYEIIELSLYGQAGVRSLAEDDPRLLVLEPETNILIVKDYPDRIKEVEAILTNQELLRQLEQEELVAREFRISLEPEPPEGVSRVEWEYRRQQEINYVVDILQQMLYGFEGREEAIAQGRRIFRRSDYNLEEDGTITVVDTPENIRKVEELISQQRGGGGNVIDIVRVQHADITELVRLLNRVTGRYRDRDDDFGGTTTGDDQFERQDRMRVMIYDDPASQQIIFRARAERRGEIDVIKDILSRLDVPVPQVEIESRLVEISMDDTKGLDFDWGFTELFEDNILIDDDNNRDTALNLINQSAQGMAFQLATLGHSRFNFAMNAIEQISNAEILSAPKVTVVSDAEANIDIITREPYITEIETDTRGTDTVADDILRPVFDPDGAEIGIALTVSPTVLGDGNVIMDVNPVITTLEGRIPVQVAAIEGEDAGVGIGAIEGLGQPIIGERSAETRVKVKDGDTLVIGGLIRDELTRTVDKVPLLADIPWIGRFFRDTSDTNVKNQLLIFITVRIIPEG